MIVGFAPGGGTDVLARALGQQLSEMLGQPFTIDNRTGAGGIIATELGARAAPDGYTLLVGSARCKRGIAKYARIVQQAGVKID